MLIWPELRSPVSGAHLELSPDRKLMWYSKKMTDPGMIIRKVRNNLTLGEIILDTNKRRKERKEVEPERLWMMRNKLLIKLAEGVEYDKVPLVKVQHHMLLHLSSLSLTPTQGRKLSFQCRE